MTNVPSDGQNFITLAAGPSHQIEITKHSEEIKTLIRNPTMVVSWILWLNDKEYLNLISKLVHDDHDNSNCETSFVEAEATSCNRVTPRDSLSQEFSSSPASSSSSPLLSSKQERGGSSVLSALGCLSLVAETCQRDPVSPLSVSQSVFAPGSLLVFCNLLFVCPLSQKYVKSRVFLSSITPRRSLLKSLSLWFTRFHHLKVHFHLECTI